MRAGTEKEKSYAIKKVNLLYEANMKVVAPQGGAQMRNSCHELLPSGKQSL